MDVANLFYELLGGEDVEVVVPRLPEMFTTTFQEFGGLSLDDAEG
jgi:hypothetical protein